MATLSSIRSAAIEDTGFSSGLDSAQVTAIAGGVGLSVYSTLDNLPTSGLTSGDQAFVSSTNRFYISNGTGWYNVALINATPTLSISPSGAVALAIDGSTPTVITLTGTDSDNADANLVYSVESDGSFGGLATLSQDSSVFTITPLGVDSATTASSTLTFKVSDGINFGSDTTTFTLAFTVADANYTTLLAKADTAGTDNQVDASTNSYTIAENGDVTSTALSPYHPGGYSTYFDGGASTRLTLPSDIGFAFGLGAYTVEAWIYISTSAPAAIILDAGTANGSFSFLEEGGQLKLSKYGAGVQISSSAGAVNTNQWHHCAIVRTSNGANDTRLYVDGVLVGTGTDANNWTVTTTPSIGGANLTNYTLNGYIRDIRIVKGTAVYTSAFTPPTEPLTAIANTSLLTCHLPYIADGSSNGHAITVAGNTLTKRFGPYDTLGYTKADHGGSVYFDGTGDYMTAGSASNGGLSGTFTIEFWMYLTTAYTAATRTIVSNYDGSATNWAVQQRDGGQMWLTTSIGTPLSYNLNPTSNTWYHIAFSNNSSSSTGKLFVNGVEVDDHTGDLYNSSHMAASAQPITIGRLGNNTSQDFAGYIADLRIIDGTMLYTSNFTPPTAPLTAITNTKLLTCTNKNFFWDAAGTTRLVNQTAVEKQAGNFASSVSYYFDGSGDYIDVQTPNLQSDYTFGKNGEPFTIEFWIKPNSNSNTQFWFNASGGAASWSTSNGHHFFIYLASGNVNIEFNIGNNLTTMSFSASLINTAAWQHMAWAYDGTTHRVFLNGTQRASSVASIAAVTAGTYTVRWGRHADLGQAGYFAGYMQDMRVTKGLARYTATFTPPTAEFGG